MLVTVVLVWYYNGRCFSHMTFVVTTNEHGCRFKKGRQEFTQ